MGTDPRTRAALHVAVAVSALIVASCVTAQSPASPPPIVASPPASAAASAVTGANTQSATIFVDPSGDDRGPGTQSQPLRTLPAAQAAARQLTARDPRGEVRVMLRAGTYALDVPLRFDGRDAPTDTAKVTYSGPPDASAIITSGRWITGWEPLTGGLHRARLAPGWRFSTMWENGEVATLARSPNTGYATVAADVGAGGSTTQLVYAPGDVPDDLDLAGARVYIWSGAQGTPPRLVNNDWEVDIVPVKAVDRATRTVTLADATVYPMRRGNRYVLQGSRTLVDRPGEFAVSDAEGFVYYRPRREPIDQQQVVAPATSRLIEVVGTQAAPVRNLVFERLTFDELHHKVK